MQTVYVDYPGKGVAVTERMRMHFVVKAQANEAPWIACEPYVENLSILDHGFLGFDLPHGTTGEEANAIAEYLNEKISTVSYTVAPGWGEQR